MKYFILDVFCKEKYSGNQLAVVFAHASISDQEMQTIANEFHFSETTFVFGTDQGNKTWQAKQTGVANQTDPTDHSYSVRIFTPKNEVPFAGHPTLGTAFIIREELENRGTNSIVLNLKAGNIPVAFEDGTNLLWMRQLEPQFGNTHDPDPIAHILGLEAHDIDDRFPIQEVSTGIGFMIVPLKNLAAVKKAATNMTNYKAYFGEGSGVPMLMFCPETYEPENRINCRMFAEAFGIPEDPATGSANGCLAAYLAEHRYFGTSQINITVEQGYEMGRKSILHLRSKKEQNKYNIEVGGRVIKVAEGKLL
jgi:trans-2,3-dihydro-3-hydroxyanthranilate isomerase